MARIHTAEFQCREFAAQYPTPNVLRALSYAESGQLTWEQIAELFRNSLAVSLAEVTR